MKKLVVFIFLFYVANSYGQDYFKWRVSHERWVGKDKILHVTGSYLICAGLHSRCKLHNAMLLTSLIGLTWEIKDALVPYEKVGDIGGRGFSYTDYMIGNAGILLYASSSFIYSKLNKRSKSRTKIPEELKIAFEEINFHLPIENTNDR